MRLPPPVILRAAQLEALPWLAHGFSTRQSGVAGRDFNLATAVAHRRRFARAVAGAAWPLADLRQIHSSLIWRDPAAGGMISAGDGMISDRPARLLAIRTADCCPILLVDVRRRAIAAVHAGWRGTLARIAEKAVGEMRAAFGTVPGDLRAAIGPGIRGCCYQVGEEVHQAFLSRFAYAATLFENAEDDPVHSRYPMLFMTGAPPGHPPDHDYDTRWNPARPLRLDLAQANARQLADAGLSLGAVEVMPFCTACRHDLFFSHRQGDTGRMMAAIGLRPDITP